MRFDKYRRKYKGEDIYNELCDVEDLFVVCYVKPDFIDKVCNYIIGYDGVLASQLVSHIRNGYGVLSGIDYINYYHIGRTEIQIGGCFIDAKMLDFVLVEIDNYEIECVDSITAYALSGYEDSPLFHFVDMFGKIDELLGNASIVNGNNKKEMIVMMNKIGMTYSGEMAILRGSDYLVYTEGKLNNVRNAAIDIKTAILEVTKDTLKRGDIVLHNNEYLFVDDTSKNIMLVSVDGKRFDLIEEMSTGMPSPIYKKIVNPLDASQISNPMVAMSMMTNGTSMDAVSQMALMNILNGKKEDTRMDKIEDSVSAMANSIKILADIVASTVVKD